MSWLSRIAATSSLALMIIGATPTTIARSNAVRYSHVLATAVRNGCIASSGAGSYEESFGVRQTVACPSRYSRSRDPSHGSAPTTRTVDCGAPQSTDGHLPTNQAAVCAGGQQFCALPPTAARNPHITTEVIQKQNPDGSWTQLSMLCHVVLGRITPAQVTAQMASDAARRLLPHPAVRTTG